MRPPGLGPSGLDQDFRLTLGDRGFDLQELRLTLDLHEFRLTLIGGDAWQLRRVRREESAHQEQPEEERTPAQVPAACC